MSKQKSDAPSSTHREESFKIKTRVPGAGAEPASGGTKFERREVQEAFGRGEAVYQIGESDWLTRAELHGPPQNEMQRIAQHNFGLIQEAGTKLLFEQYVESMSKRLMALPPEQLGIEHPLTQREAKSSILNYIESIDKARFAKEFNEFWEWKEPAEKPMKRQRRGRKPENQ